MNESSPGAPEVTATAPLILDFLLFLVSLPKAFASSTEQLFRCADNQG